MTNAVPIRIADAVTSQINAAVTAEEFQTLGFVARRSYPDWDETLANLEDLFVDVITPMNEDEPTGLGTASQIEYSPTVLIVVRKRFVDTDRISTVGTNAGRLKTASVDALVTLLDEIRRYFIARRNDTLLADFTDVRWDSQSQAKRWYDPHKLREGLFEGFVQLKFTVNEAI